MDEAYPYISKRLLTDDSPRLREALRYMIYGKSNVFDVERLIDLLQVGWSWLGLEVDVSKTSYVKRKRDRKCFFLKVLGGVGCAQDDATLLEVDSIAHAV